MIHCDIVQELSNQDTFWVSDCEYSSESSSWTPWKHLCANLKPLLINNTITITILYRIAVASQNKIFLYPFHLHNHKEPKRFPTLCCIGSVALISIYYVQQCVVQKSAVASTSTLWDVRYNVLSVSWRFPNTP